MPVPLRTSNLKVEAKFNVVTEFPNFNLHAAAAVGNVGLVEYALSRGQPVNSVLDGVLPLHAACAGGNEQVVKLLIDHGADVNAPRLPRKYSTGGVRDASAPIVGTSGSTPLHFAAANGNKNIILTLLLRGAHPDRADKHGVTPEILARRNGWIECAELLQNWAEKRDRDLRERENPTDEQLQAPTMLESEASSSSRKRIQVKRSIDTALNMLKVSSTGLSDSYLRPPPSSSNSHTPPASPNKAEYLSQWISPDDARFSPSPSPIDLANRRPSLPHVFHSPAVATSRSHRPSTLTKTSPSPRRPRSAGTGADREEPNIPSFGRGAGRLSSKYSLMNIFKKAGENDNITSHQTSSSLSISLSPSQSTFTSSESGTPSRPNRHRMAGEPSSRTPSNQSQVSPFYSKSISKTQDFSPPLIPLAVDLHNALTQRQIMPTPSESRVDLLNASGATVDENFRFGSPGSPSSSPLTRLGLLRKGPSGHFRDRSGSGASLSALSTQRSGDEDANSDTSGRTKSARPGILRGHQRSTSFSQNQSSSRALRFDATGGTELRNKDNLADRVPDSAPATIADFIAPEEVVEEDDEYGRPLLHTTTRSTGKEEILSSSHFPFSLDIPPDEPESPEPVKGHSQLLTTRPSRDRGDSISSNSTTDSLFNQPNATETTSAGSGSVTTPVLSAGEFPSFQSSPRDFLKKLPDSHSDAKADNTIVARRGNAVLDIDMSLIESHAEAEALVQKAQQDILDLSHPDSLSPEVTSGEGWTPLSARLAAYGEILALEKRLRQQKEEQEKSVIDAILQSPNRTDSISPPSKGRNGVNRQCSLEQKSPIRNRIKTPRRPHTSSGTASTTDSHSPSTDTVDTSTTTRNPFHSAPAEDHHSHQDGDPRYNHVALAHNTDLDEGLSRVSSLDGIDTDSDFGGPLTRVSTAPMTSPLMKGKRDQSRSATKLTRMGFPNDLTRAPTPITTNKRFGSGLKSLMQSFKGKP